VGADERKAYFADDLAQSMQAGDDLTRGFMKWVAALCAKQGIETPWEVPGPANLTSRTELDLDAEGVTSVIWTSGFRPDYGWVHAPVFDDMGFPLQTDGRSEVPGLYFMGVHFQRKAQSAVLYGVGEDAEVVVNHIVENWR
jgi:putative flavoprotein involved in K+ transport